MAERLKYNMAENVPLLKESIRNTRTFPMTIYIIRLGIPNRRCLAQNRSTHSLRNFTGKASQFRLVVLYPLSLEKSRDKV